MVLFAGPIFPEWFDDVVFVLAVSPIALVIGLLVDLPVRRRLHVTTRVLLGTVVAVVVTLLGFGGRALYEDIRFERHAAAVADRFTFTPYQPERLPVPFVTETVYADDEFGGPALISDYGPLGTAWQQPPGSQLSLRQGHCSLNGLAGPGGSTFDGPCRALRSTNGIPVFVAVSTGVYTNVFAVLDGTLVRLWVETRVADRDLLAYFESLRPVSKDAIEFAQAA
jgi:hypothetical protein